MSRSATHSIDDVVGGWLILSNPVVDQVEDTVEYRCQCITCGRKEVRAKGMLKRHVLGCRDCFATRMRHGSVLENGRKTCACCRENKPASDFGVHYSQKDKLNARCRRCHKNANLVRQYGITVEDYEALLDSQHYRCAICGKHASEEKNKDLSVDHCHVSGKVRGLLCQVCNCGLGWVGDDPSILLRAATYLNQHAPCTQGRDI